MKAIAFEEVVKEALQLLPLHGWDSSLSMMNMFTAEYTREKMLPLAFLIRAGMEEEKRGCIQNAQQLLEQANKYFSRKLRVKYPLELEVPSAMPKNDGLNFREFNGGMLGFLRSMVEKDSSALEGLVEEPELLALNACTWAYHHAQRREPYSFFKAESTSF